MFRIKIAPEKGGNREFETHGEALSWVERQKLEFTTIFGSIPALSDTDLPAMRATWVDLAEYLKSYPNKFSEGEDVVIPPSWLVVPSSIAGQTIFEIGQKMGGNALRGALYAADMPIENLDWSKTDTIAGAQVYQIEITKKQKAIENESFTNLNGGVQDLDGRVKGLAGQVLELSSKVSRVSALAGAGAETTEQRLKSLAADIEAMSSSLMADFRNAEVRLESIASASQSTLAMYEGQAENATREARKRLDDWIVAQMQAVRLAAPVKLWNGRSRLHRKSGRDLGKFALKAGISGTIITPFVAWLAFIGARSMLSDATLDKAEAAKKSVAGIRPTLHFELIFAGTITLFWLTMFFWLMRLIVKRYTGEQRLAIDASGRSATAQTYLGFVAEGAAGKEERPLIVEALFRPVTADGKGDDGPPAISVPSFISGLVAGKGG